MLAECYGRVGSDEKRLDALRQAATGDRTSDFARADFALATARSGKLDQAISTLSSLASNKPELRLDLVRLLIQKAIRQPGDRQSWQEVDKYLSEAEKALPQSVESVTLLRADMLAARDRLPEARSLLSSAQTKDPRNLRYRLALARLTQREGKGPLALQILDQAEKDLVPSLEIQLARLDYLGSRRGRGGQGGGGQARRELDNECPPPTSPYSSIGSARSRPGSATWPWPKSTCTSSPDCNRPTPRFSWGFSTWPPSPPTMPVPWIS